MAALQVPPPTITSGRVAATSNALSSASSSGEGAGLCGGGATGASVTDTRAARTSSGRDTTTGPGRPSRATRAASAAIELNSPGSSTSTDHFASGPKNASKSTSWKARRPRCAVGTWPMNSNSAVPLMEALCTATEACVAPGPRVTKATPRSPRRRAWASAMIPAPDSWRHTTVRIAGSSCRASSTARKLSPGTVKTVSTPWRRS